MFNGSSQIDNTRKTTRKYTWDKITLNGPAVYVPVRQEINCRLVVFGPSYILYFEILDTGKINIEPADRRTWCYQSFIRQDNETLNIDLVYKSDSRI